jgi:antitoxin component of MazEF toxin-antitoxin module
VRTKTLEITRIGDSCGVLLPEKDFPQFKEGDLVDVSLGKGRTIVITPLSTKVAAVADAPLHRPDA